MRHSGRNIKRYGNPCFDSLGPTELREDNFLDSMTPEFHNLVSWALGPDGIHSLQVIAFGDFSCRGRFSSHNLVLHRTDSPVAEGKLPCRLLDPRLDREGSLYDDIREFLEACPSESLSYHEKPAMEEFAGDFFRFTVESGLLPIEDESSNSDL